MPSFISDYSRRLDQIPSAGSPLDPESIGQVYVLGPVSGEALKIGSSHHAPSRLGSIQVAHWVPLKLYSVVSIYSGSLVDVEFAAHKEAEKIGWRVSGEWFQDISPEDCLRCILAAARKKKVRFGACAVALEQFKPNNDARVVREEAERISTLRRKLGMAPDEFELRA